MCNSFCNILFLCRCVFFDKLIPLWQSFWIFSLHSSILATHTYQYLHTKWNDVLYFSHLNYILRKSVQKVQLFYPCHFFFACFFPQYIIWAIPYQLLYMHSIRTFIECYARSNAFIANSLIEFVSVNVSVRFFSCFFMLSGGSAFSLHILYLYISKHFIYNFTFYRFFICFLYFISDFNSSNNFVYTVNSFGVSHFPSTARGIFIISFLFLDIFLMIWFVLLICN